MKKSKTNGATDALELLRQDHKKVAKMFKDFERIAEDGGSEKDELVQQICTELTVHATIEEEVFYPAVREVIEEEDLMDEAEVEHASLKSLVEQLEGMTSEDELFDAKVTVLGEYVEHHVKEEQDEMFPKVEKTDLDLESLGAELQQRKEELLEELGASDEDEEDETDEEEDEEEDEKKPAGAGSTSTSKSSGGRRS